jgi:hypothetical protein
VGTLFLVPAMVVHTGWSYWVFRGKVRADVDYHRPRLGAPAGWMSFLLKLRAVTAPTDTKVSWTSSHGWHIVVSYGPAIFVPEEKRSRPARTETMGKAM